MPEKTTEDLGRFRGITPGTTMPRVLQAHIPVIILGAKSRMETGMDAKQQELEARIVAIEYTLKVIVNCLSDRQSMDRQKVLRLLRTAAEAPEAGESNPAIPVALNSLAEHL
jgi:hypothetical protein